MVDGGDSLGGAEPGDAGNAGGVADHGQALGTVVAKSNHQVVGHPAGAAKAVHIDHGAVGNVGYRLGRAGEHLVGPRQLGDFEGHFAKIRRHRQGRLGHGSHVVRGPAGGYLYEFQRRIGDSQDRNVANDYRHATATIDGQAAVANDPGDATVGRVRHHGDESAGARRKVDSKSRSGEAEGFCGCPVHEVAVLAHLGSLDKSYVDVPACQHGRDIDRSDDDAAGQQRRRFACTVHEWPRSSRTVADCAAFCEQPNAATFRNRSGDGRGETRANGCGFTGLDFLRCPESQFLGVESVAWHSAASVLWFVRMREEARVRPRASGSALQEATRPGQGAGRIWPELSLFPGRYPPAHKSRRPLRCLPVPP